MLPIFWAEKLTLDLSAPYYGLSPTPSGATAIEYALIAALVSVGAVVALNSMGASLNQMFSYVSLQLVIPENIAPNGPEDIPPNGEAPQCVEVDSSCDK